MNVQEQINYWLVSADHDLATAESMFEKKHFDWCLFIGHLVLEKALKARYVQDNQEIPPRIHDLLKLAKNSTLKLSIEQEKFLMYVNNFNMEARYPDEKLEFYKICDQHFANENFIKIKEMYQWLKSQMIYLAS